MKIAIIGAGVTGSVLAQTLALQGNQVDVFEKSRGRGGRCSYKRTTWGAFDMGATVIPASDDDFVRFMQQQVNDGIAQAWPTQVHDYNNTLTLRRDNRAYYLFAPGMNAGCRAWLDKSRLHTASKIVSLQELSDGWLLWDEDEGKHGPFDRIVLTAPLPQTKALLDPWLDVDMAASLEMQWLSCWTVGCQLKEAINTPAELIYLHNQPIQTLINQSAKPGSDTSLPIWVAQFDNHFSDQHHTMETGQLMTLVGEQFEQVFNTRVSFEHAYQHFWRYARPSPSAVKPGILSFQRDTLLAGGDWSFGGSVQAAYLAATRLFEQIAR